MNKILVVFFLFFSAFLFSEDSRSDGKQMINLENSISGKNFFELRFNFLHYKFGSNFEGILNGLNDELEQESKLLFSSFGLPVPSLEFDFDMDIQSFGIEGVFNKNLNSFIDIGVIGGINFYQGPNISLTASSGGDVVRSEIKSDHIQFHLSPFLQIRREIEFNEVFRSVPNLSMGAKVFYHNTNAELSISSNLGMATFEVDQDISEFEVYPFIDVGVEIWMHKICLYPSIGYHKDLFLGNEYNINMGVGFYYVWGLYDSVFFRYSRLSSDDFDRDEFLLGASVSLF